MNDTDMLPGSYPHRKYGLYGLKHHIVEIKEDMSLCGTDNDGDKQLKIELLSQWKLEAEFRNSVSRILAHCSHFRTLLVSIRVCKYVGTLYNS